MALTNGTLPKSESSLTRFSAGTIVRGKIIAKDDIRIDGIVEGEIICEGRVVTGDESKIDTNIDTAQMDINGVFNGEVVAKDKISIGPKGNFSGKISTPKITVENGAVINGQIEMPAS